jgi:hypothetical protein
MAFNKNLYEGVYIPLSVEKWGSNTSFIFYSVTGYLCFVSLFGVEKAAYGFLHFEVYS